MKTTPTKKLILTLACLCFGSLAACAPPPLAKDARSLAAYYLDDYQVGMKWEYTIELIQVGISLPERDDTPAQISLPWQLELTGLTDENRMKKIFALLDQKKNLGKWVVEVMAVEPEQVTIRSEMTSNSPHVTAVPAETKVYTRKTIGELYTPVLQLTPAEDRSLSFVKSSVNRGMAGNFLEKITGDEFEGEYKTRNATFDTEEVTLWISAKKGLIEKYVTLSGNYDGARSRSTLGLRIETLTGL